MKFERSEHKGIRYAKDGELGTKRDKWDKPSLQRTLVLPEFDLTAALCGQTDPELFFPEKGDNAKPALEICGKCDVRLECLEWALKNDERYGIWGGTTPKQRAYLKGGRWVRGHIVMNTQKGRPSGR